MDIYGISSIFCFLIGTPFNIMSYAYFHSREQSSESILFIYSLISVTDTVICALSLAPMVSYILAGGPGIFGGPLPCTLWDILMEVFVRYSLILVAILGVCRARALIYPLRIFCRQRIGWVAKGVLFLLLLQEILPTIILREFSTYVPERLSCHFFGLEAVLTPLQTMIFKLVTFFGEIGVPMVVGGVTGGLCFYELVVKDDKYESDVTAVQKKKKREATKTIVIVTGLSVLLNLPIVCFATAFSLEVRMSTRTILIGVDLASSLVVLNSVFNSLIYYFRIKRMRLFARRLIMDKAPCSRTTPAVTDKNET